MLLSIQFGQNFALAKSVGTCKFGQRNLAFAAGGLEWTDYGTGKPKAGVLHLSAER